ncbi:hypothetical protein ACFSF2_13880 [Paenibacillus rhizophilus]
MKKAASKSGPHRVHRSLAAAVINNHFDDLPHGPSMCGRWSLRLFCLGWWGMRRK